MVADPLERLQAALSDRYAIEREIGRGGNAVVYLARDRKHDRRVALKVLLPELALAVRAERFLREIQIAAKLSHPRILPLYDSGEAAGALYYVMPYVEGESLRERLEREPQLPLEEALRITREVAAALSYAHEQGVVHRDIKPENILLARGEAVVADFGIARALSVAGDRGVTETGVSVGTPAYMSPEQASGGAVDARGDLYSLGCVLYEMLAGHAPFTGATAQEVMSRHALDPVPSLQAARPDVPAGIEQVVVKALAKVPVARFPQAGDLVAALSAPATRPRKRPAGALYAALGLGAVLLAAASVQAVRSVLAGSVEQQSVAVLPFVNLSTTDEDQYFSDGITEELIDALTQVPALRVPARASSFAFQGKSTDIREIGRQLGVAHVLEGTLRRAGALVRVHAQLSHVTDGFTLWSHTFEVEVDPRELFTVQDQIADAVVTALVARLSPGDAALSRRPAPSSTEAYDLYLQGRQARSRGTEDDLNRARELFAAATAEDSGYAPAWAGLADTYMRLQGLRYLSRAEALGPAKAAADRAVALDSQLAEAYVSRARVRWLSEYDWSGAEQDVQHALRLAAGNAGAHQFYGGLLVQQARIEEGIRELRLAIDLDPLSAARLLACSAQLTWAQQYPQALALIRKAVALVGPTPLSHQRLAALHLRQGRFAEAIEEYQAALDLLGNRGRTAVNLAQLGYAYALAGRRDEALAILDDLQARWERAEGGLIGYAFQAAVLYAGLGETDRALAWLEKAYEDRDWALTNLRIYPFFDPLRADLRFSELSKKVGL